MKENINYTDVPHHYPICLKRECPKADTCLRQIAEQLTPAKVEFCFIVNPKFVADLKKGCPHYRSTQKVRYAKGFMEILGILPYKQMQIAVSRLMEHFGRRAYYHFRKGERLLSPAEQQIVMNIFMKYGLTQPHDFDAYTEKYNW